MNATDKSQELLELLDKVKQAKESLNIVNHALHEYQDGYTHVLVLHRYNTRDVIKCNNLEVLCQEGDNFNGDNGIATLYTTNPYIKGYESSYWEINVVDDNIMKNILADKTRFLK